MKKGLIIFFLIIAIFLAGCQSQQPSSESAVTPIESGKIIETGSDKASETSAAAQTNIVKIDVTAKQWDFDPSTITVNKGDRVKLSIKSIDVDHGFAIPEFNVNERLEPGKTINVEFTADKEGTYTFFCNVFCGSGHSDMKGTLIVQ